MSRQLFLILTIALFPAYVMAENVVLETEWLSNQGTTDKLREMDGNRLFPCRIEGKVDGVTLKYKSAYCPFTKNMKYFYSHWGMSDHWYTSNTEKYLKKGYLEYSHTSFEDLGGNTVHQATWIINNDAQPVNSNGPLRGLIDFLESIDKNLSNN